MRKSVFVEEQSGPRKFDAQFLSEMFVQDLIEDGQSYLRIQQQGDITGLALKLGTDLNKGLSDMDAVAAHRRDFGNNIPVEKELTSVWQLIYECLEDTMLQILLMAALCSTGVGILNEGGSTGWMEGATIFIAVFLIVSITAGNNWIKERQFRKLKRKLDEGQVQVMRGGYPQDIDTKDLVVGDILMFKIGDLLVVDGIMISGTQVKADESSVTGETEQIKKQAWEQINLTSLKAQTSQLSERRATPFLISGTKIVDGIGTMLVLAVGQNTTQGKLHLLLEEDNPPTPLQQKLEAVAEDIGKVGTVVSILTFTALTIHQCFNCIWGDQIFMSLITLQAFIKAFMIAITIIVVAVPEGLPLAVTIALAYSVNKMKDEQNLVKHLASCETMGGANNICSDKTGTLTQNDMTATAIWIENQIFQNDAILSKKNYISRQSQDLLAEAIGYNTQAFPKKNTQTGKLIKNGNKTDCALIELSDNWGYPLYAFRPSDKIIRIIPFNSNRKKMSTIILNSNQTGIRVYVKGASEIILQHCIKLQIQNGQDHILDQTLKNQVSKNVIEKFANQALRTIGVAYKDIFISGGLTNIKQKIQEFKEEDLDTNLTLISIIGIKDPIRKDVPKAIQQCKDSGIKVRMVTGDNILTATAIARECGILPKEFISNIGSYEILEGKKFRELVGNLKENKDEDGKVQYTVQNLEMFARVTKELKVLARATPEDKFILVTGLIELDNIVAVTGDGTNDAPALKRADVGFAMGISGTDVAKDAADIILLDDNFSSIITAVKWGRNIYNNIRKFIQFQLTVNIVALFMSFIGAVIITESPLNAIQMLWVNLIMDTFASLALATEPPDLSVLNTLPHSRKDPIVSTNMYKTVVFQSIYQICVLIFILFYLQDIIDLTAPQGQKQNIVQLTIFFQTFVLMQVFNSINARKLSGSVNPFKGLFNNYMFWLIQIFTLIVQFLIIQYGGSYVKVINLTLQQHLLCLIMGASSILVGILVKVFPTCKRFEIIKDREIEQNEMDNTLTSKLRRKSTVRLHSSQNKGSALLISINKGSSDAEKRPSQLKIPNTGAIQ